MVSSRSCNSSASDFQQTSFFAHTCTHSHITWHAYLHIVVSVLQCVLLFTFMEEIDFSDWCSSFKVFLSLSWWWLASREVESVSSLLYLAVHRFYLFLIFWSLCLHVSFLLAYFILMVHGSASTLKRMSVHCIETYREGYPCRLRHH